MGVGEVKSRLKGCYSSASQREKLVSRQSEWKANNGEATRMPSGILLYGMMPPATRTKIFGTRLFFRITFFRKSFVLQKIFLQKKKNLKF